MSWLRTSPLRQSNRSSRGRALDTGTDFDPRACYDSFCKHWQQAYEIILRSESDRTPTHDDVLGVVNHLDHMVTLLLVELHHCNKLTLPATQQPPAPCLEFMLSENLLNKLCEWGKSTGRYANAVLLEQLKLYELLVSHSRHQLLVHEPFLRPLLKILASSQSEIFPPDVAKRLVILLNQLCVVLMQNVHLLDLFFFSTSQQQEHGATNFIIFSLLIPYVHCEGSLGHQARDALLLCMALSQKNSNVGKYIAQYSSMCPVLVTGLGGLYSLLPNTIEITTIDWHRITPDDVAEMSALTSFMNSLEFCNAVVQVAHNLIRQQLLDFMYQGFLVPVLGSTLLQIFNGSHLQTNIESQISAMAYLDLILRSVTEPGLLRIFVKFLLDEEKFDGHRIIDVLIERLNSADTRLCMVTLSLFDTLLSIHCEDIVLELILKFLLPCQHVPISHRHKINDVTPYSTAVHYFLDLSPEVMKHVNSTIVQQQIQPVSKTIGANWNHYGLHTGESLYSNYHAYLFDARHKISQCKQACDQWSNTYRYQKLSSPKKSQNSEKVIDMIKNFYSEFKNNDINHQYSGEIIVNSDKGKQHDSLQSLGESSGYESFKYRPEDDLIVNEDIKDYDKNIAAKEPWKVSSIKRETIFDMDFSEDLFTQGTISLGPFLSSIWGKLQTFTSNCLYVNLHLTGLITRMAWYPLPILQSILLRSDIPTTSDTPSFHQVLKILKQQIDAELPVSEESLEIVDVARSYLIDREFRLVNSRKNAIDAKNIATNKNGTSSGNYNQSTAATTTTANLSATTPLQLTPSSSYDPFKRNDSKRKSLTQSFSSMFRRPSNTASTGLAQLKAFFTGSSSIAGNSIPLRDTVTSEPTSLDSLSSLSSMGGMVTGSSERTKDLALCAVILDEWLKELSAISQEQSIVMLSDYFCIDK